MHYINFTVYILILIILVHIYTIYGNNFMKTINVEYNNYTLCGWTSYIGEFIVLGIYKVYLNLSPNSSSPKMHQRLRWIELKYQIILPNSLRVLNAEFQNLIEQRLCGMQKHWLNLKWIMI